MKISFFSLIAIVCLFLQSCEDGDHLYDGKNLVHFAEEKVNYYMIDDDNSSFEIIIGGTKVCSRDYTVTVEVVADESTAKENREFTIENKVVTIPAGKPFGMLQLNGIFENNNQYGEILQLKIAETNSDGVASYNQIINVHLYQHCPFNIDAFIGNFVFTSGLTGKSWDVEMIKVDEQSVVIKDLFSEGHDRIINFDTEEIGNYQAYVDPHIAFLSDKYGEVRAAGYGSFSSCTQEIELKLEYYDATGSFGIQTDVLKKK